MNSRKYFSVTNTKLQSYYASKRDILTVFHGWDSFVREKLLIPEFH